MLIVTAMGGQSNRRSSSVASSSALVAPIWEIGGLAALIGFYFFGYEAWGEGGFEFVNWTGPFALMAILGAGAYRMAKVDPATIWTPLLWFRIATAAYFGFGNVFPFMANVTTRLYFDEWFYAQPWHYYKLNLIVALSVLLVVASGSLTGGRTRRARSPSQDNGALLLALGLFFAAVGIATKLFVILPNEMRHAGEGVSNGSMVALALLSPVSLYMLTQYAIKYRPWLFSFVFLLAILDISTSFIMFNKFEILISILMFFFAFMSDKIRVWKIFISFTLMLFFFIVIFPIVNFGREEIWTRYQSKGAGLLERLEIAQLYFSRKEALAIDEEVQSISRLSYVYEAALAIDQYDGGRPGHSLDQAWVVLIPRILWPQKPMISDIGRQFTTLAGAPESSTAPGIFADAYWDFGWLGIPALMIPIGLFLGLASRYCVRVIADGSWIQFPVIMSIMKMGIRVDGFIIVDYAGAAVIIFFLYCGAKIVERLIHPLFRRRRTRSNGGPLLTRPMSTLF